MNKLIFLVKALGKINLRKEASEVLKLSPVEHPDWAQWSKEEAEGLLSSSVPELSGLEKLRESDPHSPEVVIDNKLKEYGITIIPKSGGNEYLGSGGHGKVYDCVFGGKPAVAKIQINEGRYPRPYGRDVLNWNKLQEKMSTFPEWVKKYLPEVLFAKEDVVKILGPFGDEDHNFQVMVMEKLRPLPKEISLSMNGGSNLLWKWEDAFEGIYSEVSKAMLDAGLESPDEQSFFDSLVSPSGKGTNLGPLGRMTRYLFDIIRASDLEIEERSALTDKVLAPLFEESKKIGRPIPRFSSYGYDDIWKAPRDLEGLWKAIVWLRSNGVPAGDIVSENIMIDSSGQMKIADLGAMHRGD